MGEMKNTYHILGVKPQEKRPLGSPRHRWKDNIKMDHREIDFRVWIGLAPMFH
jgi:hypothetical protein